MGIFRATPGWVKGRQLTAGERDEARHMLQALLEGARTVRNAIEPQTGAFGVSVGQWRSQWAALKRDLDSFTERVSVGYEPTQAPRECLLTAEQIAGLERSFTPAEDQRCPVCGAPLQLSASDHRGTRYNCSSDAANATIPGMLRERLEHYDASTWYDRGQTNALVALLIRAYRKQLEGNR